jgi:hypothetical protein
MEQMRDTPISLSQQPREWTKLIHKLRWIGMEDEARCLAIAVSSLPPHERGTVFAGPFSTD